MLQSPEDMIAVAMTSDGVRIVATFGAEPRYGTNPIAIAEPARNEAPFLFDAATSTIAGNKLELAARIGSTLLPQWIAALDGAPNKEETLVPDPTDNYFLPLGGTREQGSHKGYRLGMMAEIMATLLSGATPNMLDSGGELRHYFAAYNIDAFTDVEEFKDTMDRTLRRLRTTRPAPGHDRVLYPGLAEFEDTQDRRANGIPLHDRWCSGSRTSPPSSRCRRWRGCRSKSRCHRPEVVWPTSCRARYEGHFSCVGRPDGARSTA